MTSDRFDPPMSWFVPNWFCSAGDRPARESLPEDQVVADVVDARPEVVLRSLPLGAGELGIRVMPSCAWSSRRTRTPETAATTSERLAVTPTARE